MSIYNDHDCEWWECTPERYQSARKAGRPMGPGAPHIPNKNEAKALRRIMSQTGLTREEVRSNPKYRKMLAQAQDRGENLNYSNVKKKRKRDEATRLIQEGLARKAREAEEVAAKAFKKYQKTPQYIIDLLSNEHSNV